MAGSSVGAARNGSKHFLYSIQESGKPDLQRVLSESKDPKSKIGMRYCGTQAELSLVLPSIKIVCTRPLGFLDRLRSTSARVRPGLVAGRPGGILDGGGV